MGSEPSVVLIHGAWLGPWCWDEVTEELVSRGCAVTAVELPFRGYSGDVAHARAAIKAAVREKRPVVVAAHSYGGMVATAACSGLDEVHHLVYIAAMMPDLDETVASIATRRPGLLGEAVRVGVGGRTLDPARLHDLFYGQSGVEVAELAAQRLRPMPAPAVEALTVEPAWATIPSTYVVCCQDAGLDPATQREQAMERAGQTISIESDHSPFAAHPQLTAHLILSPRPARTARAAASLAETHRP